MKTLILMRHAKADWNNSNYSDFERPLSSDGLKEAPLIGNIIYQNNLQPSLVISSPAKRAKQTAVLVKEVAEIKSKIDFQEKIYEASPVTLLQVISDFEDNLESVLLIGHNPGIEELIRILTTENQEMPTASIAIIKLNIKKWSEIGADCGLIELVVRSKDLLERVEILEYCPE